MVSMTENPKVTTDNIGMVTFDEKKHAFAARLNAVLDSADVPDNHDGRGAFLAKKFHVSIRASGKWLSGDSLPRYEKILEIIDEFQSTGVTYEWLMRGVGPGLSSSNVVGFPTECRLPVWQLPVIRWDEITEYLEGCKLSVNMEIRSWIDTTIQPSASAFAVTVESDSMQPVFAIGMIITVEPTLDPSHGDYVVVDTGGRPGFKQLIQEGGEWFLKPLNDRYPIRPLGEARIIGVIRESIQRFR